MGQVCFDSSAFYTVMIVGISIIIYVITTIYRDKLENTVDMQQMFSDKAREHENSKIEESNLRGLLAAQAQRIEDMQRMHHPLTPPVRRGPFSYTGTHGPTMVNVPTRGEYGSFQQMGYLYNTNDTDQAMPLIGRRLHSNQYEYYTFHHNNPQIKIPIKINGDREINDNDSVTVQGYNNPMQAKIYQLDSPRYIPY